MENKHGMKSNTIKMVLRNKINDWLDTLPEDMQHTVAEDVIVTGGAIASMLLGEKINDYDIYFRTKDTTHAIAKYYCTRFTDESKPANGVSKSINPTVRLEVKKNIKGEDEERVTIWIQSAGVVGENQEEYKYFESQSESSTDSYISSLEIDDQSDASIEKIEDLIEEFKPNKKVKYRPVYLSQNAITLSDKIQLVTRFFGNPEQIHRNFDYIHATGYYDYGKDELTVPAEAMAALLSRTLIYRGSLYPIASIFRIRKFLERGFRITAGEILKICWQISELDLNDKEVLQEQLLGVDQSYMWQLISALKSVEGKVDSTYVAKLIDGIF